MDQYIYPYNTSWFDLPLEMRENFDCEDFDQKIIDDYLWHLKTKGMHETTSIRVSFLTRRIFTIDIQELAPITIWEEQHHFYRKQKVQKCYYCNRMWRSKNSHKL
ncbi:unnamed protein product [Caenorhabditis angaria]|uniref:Uncharacterized protein n=1 Tax=Caenorhabditis angaria TaxID=860376 RepID=A0A9P1IDJ8_9PELO|nr:unnamed protein product [Caenorhabditis angaria]